MHHLVSQIVQFANVRIARLRDVPAGKLAEAAILNAIKGVLVLTSTPSTSSSWFAYTLHFVIESCRLWRYNSPK